MQTTSPIRRYVIVRRRERATTGSRWSMERVAPSSHGGAAAPSAAPRPLPPAIRGA